MNRKRKFRILEMFSSFQVDVELLFVSLMSCKSALNVELHKIENPCVLHEHISPYTLHYTLYTIHYSLHTTHYTLYTTHYTLFTTHYTLYTIDYTLHTTHYTLHTIHNTLHTILYTLYTTVYTLHTTHYTPHTTHFTLYTTHYTLSVAKRKACLQPEKTHGYQYLFTMQFFDSYVYRSRINKGHYGGSR